MLYDSTDKTYLVAKFLETECRMVVVRGLGE